MAVWGALHPGPHHRRAFAHQGQSPFLGSTPSHQLQVTTPAQASAPSVRPSVRLCILPNKHSPRVCLPRLVLAEGANPSLFYRPQCTKAVTKEVMTRPRTEV